MKLVLGLIAAACWLCSPAALFADDFYKDKVVRVIVGGSAGGSFVSKLNAVLNPK
jgi:tripartite-type tricarboxylate transporter receptor subunit TctC